LSCLSVVFLALIATVLACTVLGSTIGGLVRFSSAICIIGLVLGLIASAVSAIFLTAIIAVVVALSAIVAMVDGGMRDGVTTAFNATDVSIDTLVGVQSPLVCVNPAILAISFQAPGWLRGLTAIARRSLAAIARSRVGVLTERGTEV
jgi:hypothetical protein